jgi:hypothetical protein
MSLEEAQDKISLGERAERTAITADEYDAIVRGALEERKG